MDELITLSFVKGIGGLGEKMRIIFEGPGPSFRALFSCNWEPCTRVVPTLVPCTEGVCVPPGSVDSPFDKYLMSKYHVPGTMWGARNALVSKTDTTVPFWNWHAGGELKNVNEQIYGTITSFKEGCGTNTQLNYILRGNSEAQRVCNLFHMIKEISK